MSSKKTFKIVTPQMSGKYEPVKILGEGSFGKVILVKEVATGDLFAMKIIPTEGKSAEQLLDIVNEIKFLSDFDHTNIVKLVDAIMSDDMIMIIMEYADKETLFELQEKQQQKGKLKESFIMYIIIQILIGLKHMHEKNIIHRDLKAGNIFLASDKNDPREFIIKIGDLGLSRALKQDEVAFTCAGTITTMAPEVFIGGGYTTKADVWSFGCVLYELCTFNHIVTAKSQKEFILRVLVGDIPKIDTNYSKELQQVINMCLQKDPNDRADINQILDMPFIQQWAQKVVTQEVLQKEFPTLQKKQKPQESPLVEQKLVIPQRQIEQVQQPILLDKTILKSTKVVQRTAAYNNGEVYEGDIVNGIREGNGKMTYSNGDVYEGQFKNGQKNGKGKLMYNDGDIYVGEFMDGERHGQGKLTFTDGKTMEGNFVKGKYMKK